MAALDRFQVKVRLDTKKPGPPQGANIWLQFGPHQRGTPVVFGGMVWRVDAGGLITVLLSLTTREFSSLNDLVNTLLRGETAPAPSRPMPSESSPAPAAEAPIMAVLELSESSDVSPAPAAEAPIMAVLELSESSDVSPAPVAEAPVMAVLELSESSDVSPAPVAEAPVMAVPGPSESSDMNPAPVAEAPVMAVPGPSESSDMNPAQQAEALAVRGDHEGAWRFYYQALQATPEDVSLWYGLGVTLSHLNERKGVEEAFQYVVRRGRPDSEEVRLARRWLVDAGVLVEPTALTHVADPVRVVRRHDAAVKRKVTRAASEPGRAPVQQQRPMPSKSNPARQAEALVARGDYEGAWRLYHQALQAAPEDVSLWYALGLTVSRFNQQKETVEAFEPAARPDRPDSKEVRVTQRALVSAGALAELAALATASHPVGDVRRDKAAVKGKATRPAAEAGRAPLQTARSKPSKPSPAQLAEARVVDGSMTRDERERALLALIEEGHKMPPSRTAVMAKVMEMRYRGDKERSKASKKTRR